MTATEPSESFQIPIEAAEALRGRLRAGFFAQWAPIAVRRRRRSGRASGSSTSPVAPASWPARAAELVAPAGRVVGVDLNEAMLTVARRVAPDIDWRRGRRRRAAVPGRRLRRRALPDGADVLPRPGRRAPRDGPSRPARRRRRVSWSRADLDQQPALRPVRRDGGEPRRTEARSLLSTYFVCGDTDELLDTVRSAGLVEPVVTTHEGVYGAPSVADAVRTEIDSTPLARAHQLRGLRPHPAGRPRHPGPVHAGRRIAQSTVQRRRRRGPAALRASGASSM